MRPSRIRIHVAWIVGLLCLAWSFAACRVVHADDATPVRTPIATMDTKIIPGCVLNIIVDGEAEISRTYIVSDKGSVRFKIADGTGERTQEWEVALQGKTVAQAKTILTESLENYFKNPEVHVSIVKVAGLHVEISGEVPRPAVYVLPYGSRLSDLLSTALTKPSADLTNILIRRADPQSKTPGGVTSFNVDFTTGSNGDDSDDPKLVEGDKVYIRKLAELPVPAELQIVRLVGEINSLPRDVVNGAVQREDGVALPLSKGMTLKDAFERIGGLKDTADRAHIYLGRLDGTTKTLSAEKIEADDADNNVKLKPGDLVIIPRRDRSQVYAVLGEVNIPNTFEYRPGEKIRLLQALARAGDLSKKADHHRGVLSRGYLLNPTKAKAIPFDPELVRKGEQPNMELDPGDAVFIEARKKRPTIWQQLLPLVLHFLPI